MSQVEEPNSQQETFISHLVELRTRLMRSMLAMLIVFFALFYWARDIYTFLAAPLMSALPEGSSMIATEVTAPFFVPIKVTLMVSFLIALPYILWQIWSFIAPGLYQNEKKLVLPLAVSSFILFFIGMAFAYFAVFPVVFGFLAKMTPDGVSMMTDIDKYLSFTLTMFLAFGITFETPVIVLVLVSMGVFTLEQLRNARPYIIVGAFVIAAIFTPPDVVSQLFLAFPLWLLYEFGMFLAGFLKKSREENKVEA
jgi:Twin arginine targeting (Tat) protein translocase TatC